MGSPNFGPMQPFMDSVKGLPKKALDTVTMPIDALQKMLGINQPPPPDTSWHDQQVQGANNSFKPPMAQPPQPVVAPPRRKPMGGM